MSDDRYDLLKKGITFIGSEYEMEELSQFLRDEFSDHIPVEMAIKAVKEVHINSLFDQAMAFMVFAMVPVLGLSQELQLRLGRFHASENLTITDFHEWLLLANALRYLGLSQGDENLRNLKELMESRPEDLREIPLIWFKNMDEKWSKWKQDRAEGRRWYFEDEISD